MGAVVSLVKSILISVYSSAYWFVGLVVAIPSTLLAAIQGIPGLMHYLALQTLSGVWYLLIFNHVHVLDMVTSIHRKLRKLGHSLTAKFERYSDQTEYIYCRIVLRSLSLLMTPTASAPLWIFYEFAYKTFEFFGYAGAEFYHKIYKLTLKSTVDKYLGYIQQLIELEWTWEDLYN